MKKMAESTAGNGGKASHSSVGPGARRPDPKRKAKNMKADAKLSRRETVRIGTLWKIATKLDMSEREIICLQDGHRQKELAAMFGLSEGRVSQIKAKAIRKMRHPFRVRLAIALGLAERIGLSEADIAQYSDNTPVDFAVERFSWRKKPTEEDDPEEA